MLNIEDFIIRLQQLLDYYNISASVFADKLMVQRSSLSHLMSGRNKPSLDFVMRITEAYPEADLYWLLYGQGEFPRLSSQSQPGGSFQSQVTESPAPSLPVNDSIDSEPDLFSVNEEDKGVQSQSQISGAANSQPSHAEAPTSHLPIVTENVNEIERIVVFYKNGTFKNYNPGQ